MESYKPRCSRDQEQRNPDCDYPKSSRDMLTARGETFGSDGYCHDSHHSKVHDADDQKDCHQTGAALDAVESKVDAVSPSRTRIGRHCMVARVRLTTAGKVMRFPCGELERTSDQHDRSNGDRNGSSQYRLPHLDGRQRDAQRKDDHSQGGPNEEVTRADKRGQPAHMPLAGPANGLAIAR